MVDVELQEPRSPGPGEVVLRTLVSALSAGTEGLLWRGDWPPGIPWELQGPPSVYPVHPGYAAVGDIESVGQGVDPSLVGQRVFAFAPHGERSVVAIDRIVQVPAPLDPEDAVFLATLETALTVVQDGGPVVGETAGVLGLGPVGLLAGLVCAGSFSTVVWDTQPFRRARAKALGLDQVKELGEESCDVVLELTGSPRALDRAVAATRFSGRVVLGSWYGSRPVAVDLGGRFHRSRIELVSSQVSTLSPRLSGRWTKARRFEVALGYAARFRPSRLVTHRFRLEDAAEAYRQACERPGETLQVLFTYG